MELRCPSCSARHKSEDYPGAFDILCGCGYLILNPEISSAGSSVATSNDINFEGPAASEELLDEENLITLANSDPEVAPMPSAGFSTESMTPSEELPEGMLYDPFEVPKDAAPNQANPVVINDEFSTEENLAQSTISRMTEDFVQRIQKGSIGQILGPDYDLEIQELPSENKLKARERVEKFLHDQKWLREEMEKRSFLLEQLFNKEKLEKIPEALAVEIYIACLEFGGRCLFTRHGSEEEFPLN